MTLQPRHDRGESIVVQIDFDRVGGGRWHLVFDGAERSGAARDERGQALGGAEIAATGHLRIVVAERGADRPGRGAGLEQDQRFRQPEDVVGKAERIAAIGRAA